MRGILTLWVVVTCVFIVLRLSGDPAQAMLGPEAPPEALEAFRLRYGLNDPIPIQYAHCMGNVLRGDFGSSLQDQRPALDLFLSRVAATLELGIAAILIAVVVGIPLGVLAAINRNSILDRLAMGLAFIGQSAPNFFVGIMLIPLLSRQFNFLPSSGRGTWLTCTPESDPAIMRVLRSTKGDFHAQESLQRRTDYRYPAGT